MDQSHPPGPAQFSPSAQTLLQVVPLDGSAISNGALRQASGLSEAEYHEAVEELVEAGVLRRGPGRGGTVALLIGTTTAKVARASNVSDHPRPALSAPQRRRRSGQVQRTLPLEEFSDLDSGGELAGPGGLFRKIRETVPTTVGQGQVFERLMKAFLTEDPMFSQRFKRVWLWSEWPGRHGEPDTGIDLVAEEVDGGVCAVQCKFYADRQRIHREDIDTFLAASGRAPFTSRLFISTTERWSANAEKVLADQHVPVQRIGIAELEASPFDWSRFDPDHPDQLPRRTPKELRPHQVEAVKAVVSGFDSSDRGKLVMACGTGKTLTSLRLAERLVPAGGRVLFCVPSISLLSQSLRAWTSDATRPMHCVAVCSDSQVTRGEEDIHVYDLALPATTEEK